MERFVLNGQFCVWRGQRFSIYFKMFAGLVDRRTRKQDEFRDLAEHVGTGFRKNERGARTVAPRLKDFRVWAKSRRLGVRDLGGVHFLKASQEEREFPEHHFALMQVMRRLGQKAEGPIHWDRWAMLRHTHHGIVHGREKGRHRRTLRASLCVCFGASKSGCVSSCTHLHGWPLCKTLSL